MLVPTPSHQFPTGVVLSMARRLQLLEWAHQTGAWIIEDDYASEFRYGGGRALASLQGLDDFERVIYVGTLNKALFPGLRLGYAVVPPALLSAFITARYLVDRQPSTLCQVVVADFIEQGHFAAHIRRRTRLLQCIVCFPLSRKPALRCGMLIKSPTSGARVKAAAMWERTPALPPAFKQ